MKKNTWKKALALALGAALACFVLAACGNSSSASSSASSDSSSSAAADSSAAAADYKLVKDGTLTVVTSADFPPFEYMDNGKVVGYDAAVISEVAKRLGLQADISHMAFDSLISQIAGGTVADVAISGITITDDRKAEVDFSKPYYDSNLAVVVLADSKIAKVDDLANATTGAQSGTSGEDWVKENVGDKNYTPFQEVPEALASLRTGKVEALVFDEPVAKNYIETKGYNDCKILEVIPTGEQYGIAVNKDNAALTAAIDAALTEMESDGTMAKLAEELDVNVSEAEVAE
jgi:polar amino acid transport system substrate-binding protein